MSDDFRGAYAGVDRPTADLQPRHIRQTSDRRTMAMEHHTSDAWILDTLPCEMLVSEKHTD